MKISSSAALIASPIGIIRTKMISKFDAPHQPERDKKDYSTIELYPQKDFDKALHDLDGFEYIWLVWWFHRNKTWKPKVLPPRGAQKKRGVFATRSPHRPNPIGISVVPLIKITKRQITIGSCDLIDGTPILDIKPYIPSVDSFPDAKIGWLRSIEDDFSKAPSFEVSMHSKARDQALWLKDNGATFIDRALSILARDPAENRTRRIKKHDHSLYRMGCAGWRVFFSVHESKVMIHYFKIGYTLALLKDQNKKALPDREMQLLFATKWP
jgi:tRNA-Thr(GGU) m(6)t(6)A37 methyltransferase TsaA